MKPPFRTLFLVTAMACCWPATQAAAQTPPRSARPSGDAPLSGQAWKLADQAYKHYQAGRFAQAAGAAAAAVRLRPDVLRLRMLLVYSLQRAGKLDEARKAVEDAIKYGFDSPALRDASANLSQAQAGGPPPTQAYRRAFPIATQAYSEYNAQQYAESTEHAEQAFRIDPTQGAWALLWIAGLEAQEKFEDGVAAANTAISLGAPNTSDLKARIQVLRARMAVEPASRGYQAIIDNKPKDAIPFAREAVRLSPDDDSYRLLLISALMLDQQLPEAEAAATDALKQNDENTVALEMRGYLRALQGKKELADADFDEALKQDWLDEGQQRNVRLIAVDAALAAGDHARALALLAPLADKDGKESRDELVKKRLKLARSGKRAPKVLTQANFPAPIQDPRETPYGTVYELLPYDTVGYGGPSAQAYAAYDREDYQEAIRQARRAVELDPKSPIYQNLLTSTLAAGNAEQAKEAGERIDKALAERPNDPDLLVQRGYLRQRLNEPALAVDDFRAARASGKAPPDIVLAEGYALAAAGKKDEAEATFRHAIDEYDAKRLPLTPEQLYDTRGAIADVSRQWGATVSVGYRGARPAGGALGGAAISVPGDAVFSTAEVFWRPRGWLNANGRAFEAYAQVSNTLYDGGGRTLAQTGLDPCSQAPINIDPTSNRGIAGIPTTQGILGVRFTPSTDIGLTFGIERLFNLGTATRTGTFQPKRQDLRCALNQQNATGNYRSNAGNGGWQAYMTYGYYIGSELRMDQPSWFTLESYVQAGYAWQDMPSDLWLTDNTTGATTTRTSGKVKRRQYFGAFEVRAGESFRMDQISEHLVLYPYAVLGGDWIKTADRVEGLPISGVDDYELLGNASSWSLGAGLGFNVRYYFRSDHYNTARSYVDFATQYRFNIGGGQADRAKGLFLTFTLSY
ncbi:tetratricopeptide repeat protein [Pandoraea nosoerga]|uniref:TPR repeat-containing protein n=1 Tax=Pandoraea nosoerga TaxID=2508296 RepID=A0A5E4VU80_9BURK|nr:tetratricopeptide repeat protein [Pandoraea nosoerga]MBN4667981.1 tetratricopeptide repeat protein [Pandoraea nosoerga]MBN4677873.1 tetratricopeptide repeat protein [Pandoraea nosoerga]MBN4683070.1 tetratricopeptide repeat protein [Pandoraea nosoerga]MBN4747043.1 tetratricopeptide repeat protein [Pandoraea nosoerga]VVE15056.1 TPR repeat-containing protein [Pandoraea nosoerga]